MNSIKQIEVIYADHVVGRLALTKERLCAFEYSAEWLASGFSISPFELPLRSGVFIAKSQPFDGGFGVFDDCLPDDFKKSQLGEYQYMFCKWAMPNNIKGMNNYLIKHYSGKYKLTKYGGVSKHSSKYNKNAPEVTVFYSRIDAHLNPQSQISTIEMVDQ